MRAAPIEQYADLPNGRVCWFEWAGSGPTVVLVHATGFHARLWDQVVALLPQNWRVIAPDLRGHGRSYRPDEISEWKRTADDLLALRDQLGLHNFYVVGHSMGGFCAALLAAHRADSVAAALLIDPVILPPDQYALADGRAAGDWREHPVARRRNQWDSVDEMVARFATRSPYDTWQGDVLHDYCQWGLVPAASGEGLELACPPVLEASAYMGAARYNPLPDLSQVTAPITVLRARMGERSGGLDFSISPTWPDLAAHIPHARDIHWPDLTHFIPMESPERTADLLKSIVM